MDIILRGSGAVVAVAVVTVIMLSASLPLGLLVLIGVPVMAAGDHAAAQAAAPPPARPARPAGRPRHPGRRHRRGTAVLRGIGGEQVFADRYRVESQRTRGAGVRVASVESLLEERPGAAARPAGRGGDLARRAVRARGRAVGGRTRLLLRVRRLPHRPAAHADRGGRPADQGRRAPRDGSSASCRWSPRSPGPPSSATATCATRSRASWSARAWSPRSPRPRRRRPSPIADRLGRYSDGRVTLGGVPTEDLPTTAPQGARPGRRQRRRAVRRTLRDELDVRGEGDVEAAVHAACAEDIVDAPPAGLDTHVAEAGREFSGGQAAAPAAGPRADRRPGDPDPGRADQRGRRPHRGPHRRTPRQGPRRAGHPGRLHEPARARPGRPRLLRRAREAVAEGTHLRAADRPAPRYRSTVTRRGGPMEPPRSCPVADKARVRAAYARRLMVKYPRQLSAALALHGLAALSGLASRRCWAASSQDVADGAGDVSVSVIAAGHRGFRRRPGGTRPGSRSSRPRAWEVCSPSCGEFVDRVLALPLSTVERARSGILGHPDLPRRRRAVADRPLRRAGDPDRAGHRRVHGRRAVPWSAARSWRCRRCSQGAR